MDDATMNTLYGWKGRVHKAIKVFEQCKIEYVRVCALPKTDYTLRNTNTNTNTITNANTTSTNTSTSRIITTCNHDADIALVWVLLESSRQIIDSTCDGYIASIRRSFGAYRTKQEADAMASSKTTATRNDVTDPNDEADPLTELALANADADVNAAFATLWIEGVVENTINRHVKFIEQWRDIIGDAQKEVAGWKSEHEQYLEKMCEIEGERNKSEDARLSGDDEINDTNSNDNDNDNDSDDDGDSDGEDDSDDESEEDSVPDLGNDPHELLRMGRKVDTHADRLFRIGTYVSAGKVLISTLKIARKIECIEAATQEAGTACIMGLTQRNLRGRDAALNHFNNAFAANRRQDGNDDGNGDGNGNEETVTEDRNQSESAIVESWKAQTDTSKVDAIYSWYRMYHGALTQMNTKHLNAKHII